MKKFLLLFIFLFVLVSVSFASLFVSLLSTHSNCGLMNGAITLSVGGGLPPYTYLWSNGSTMPNLSGLGAGVYYVVVTDANGDTASDTAVIADIPALGNVYFTYVLPPSNPTLQTSLPCHSQCNGTIYLDVNSVAGTPPYMISLGISSNPAIMPTMVSGIPAMTNICVNDYYDILVTDATGCSVTVSQTPPDPLRSFDHNLNVHGACFGLNNGEVSFEFNNLYVSTLDVIYSGPVADTITVNSPFTVSNLLPGNYAFNIAYDPIVNCDTTILVTIPDLGSSCGTISGKVFIDTIPNCIADMNEPSVPQQLIRFDPGAYFATSDANGNYTAFLPYNTYDATLLSSAPLYPVCNVTGIQLTALNDSITGVDLGDSVNLTTDIKAGLVASAFRPGFPSYLYPTITNLSTDLIPYPSIDIFYDPILTYQFSPSYTPSVNVPGHLQFMTNAIIPFGSQNFYIQFLTPANASLIGTTLNFAIVAHANIPEPDTLNNVDSLQVVITGGYDPNDKMVSPSRDSMNTFFTDIDDEFRYNIRFQNTGTDTTFNVVVIDTLDANLDPSTLTIVASSHPMRWELSGQGVLKFYFDNILLPDSNTNEAASHGAIAYKIKPSAMAIPDYYVYNRADIYFDFNQPVLTNTVSSQVTISVGLSSVSKQKEFLIFPNPAYDIAEIVLLKNIQVQKMKVVNLTGQELISTKVQFINQKFELDISTLSTGYYILNIEDENGQMFSSPLLIRH